MSEKPHPLYLTQSELLELVTTVADRVYGVDVPERPGHPADVWINLETVGMIVTETLGWAIYRDRQP